MRVVEECAFFSHLGTLPYIFYEEAVFIEVSVSLKKVLNSFKNFNIISNQRLFHKMYYNNSPSVIELRMQQKNFQLIIITHDEDFVRALGRGAEYVEYYFMVYKDDM